MRFHLHRAQLAVVLLAIPLIAGVPVAHADALASSGPSDQNVSMAASSAGNASPVAVSSAGLPGNTAPASPVPAAGTPGDEPPANPPADAAPSSTANTSAPGSAESQTPAASSSAAPPGAGSQPSAPGEGTQPAAPVNTTTQEIWQVQSSGCTANCHGLTQSQSAGQLNTTVRGGPSSPASSSNSHHETHVTQLQLGCMSHCFGASTKASSAQLADSNLAQFLSAQVPPDLPPPPSGASPAIVTTQSSYQSQDGAPADGSQAQSATQTAATIWGTIDPATWLTALAGITNWVDGVSTTFAGSAISAAGQQEGSWSPGAVGEVVNQVEQAIWQFQIGCLISCFDTQQSQEADQSDMTIWVLPSASGSPPDGTADVGGGLPATGYTYQLVWQLQVGCLFWCYDAIETQTATTSVGSTTVVVPNPTAQQPPPPSGFASSPPGTGLAGPPPPASAVAPPVAPGAAQAATSSPPSIGPVRTGPRGMRSGSPACVSMRTLGFVATRRCVLVMLTSTSNAGRPASTGAVGEATPGVAGGPLRRVAAGPLPGGEGAGTPIMGVGLPQSSFRFKRRAIRAAHRVSFGGLVPATASVAAPGHSSLLWPVVEVLIGLALLCGIAREAAQTRRGM